MISTGLALGTTILTLAAFTLAGLWYSRGKLGSVEDFITARGTANGGMTTATLIASGMGAWILFSPAEAGAAFGGIAAIAGYALGSALPFVAFVWVGSRVRRLIPQGHSLTEYVYVRYGPAMYLYVLIISIVYMFIFLSAEMTGIAGALSIVAGVPEWQTALLIGGFVLIYTGYGGIVASIFTDTVQTLIILPLLAVGFGGALVSLGGAGEIYRTVTATQPELLDPTFLPGLEFGAYVMIAVLASNMFNQGLWQRIFAARDEGTVRRSFATAALAVIPMIFLAGLFGLAAVGLDLIGEPADASMAFFLVLRETFPSGLVLALVLLAILLVMSSADTMFNAIASIFTADLPLVIESPDQRTLSLASRITTILVAAGAIFVGSRGHSVLELFLLADLLAAATVFPFLYGLYSERVHPGAALPASLTALLFGLIYFPIAREWMSRLPILGEVLPSPSFLVSFVGATTVSILLTLLGTVVADHRFDFNRLGEEIQSLDRPSRGGQAGTEPSGFPEGDAR